MNRKKQFDSLTALKGLFIILIALHNSLNLNSLFDNVPGTSFIRLFGGELGDALFFILSGFLFSYSYRERIQSGLISFQSFILRRLQKLFPLYIVSNFVSLILVIIQHGISAAPLTKTMFTVLLQMGGGLHIGVPYNSPTWFLSTLFVCYICFFFICFHAKNPTAYYCMITFGIIWGYTLQKVNWNLPFGYPSTGLGLMNFFIGCILSEMSPPPADIPAKYTVYYSLPHSVFCCLVFT